MHSQDVEFVFSSCAAFNCWVEPRCGVESVIGTAVALKQREGNETCYHRLYYFGIGTRLPPTFHTPNARSLHCRFVRTDCG